MHRPIQPSSRPGWWALWLGFAAGLWVRVFPALSGQLGPQLGDRMPLDLAGAVEAVTGRRGGSAITCAALNALATKQEILP